MDEGDLQGVWRHKGAELRFRSFDPRLCCHLLELVLVLEVADACTGVAAVSGRRTGPRRPGLHGGISPALAPGLAWIKCSTHFTEHFSSNFRI